MSFLIDHQNIANTVKVPFPPSITEDEIVQIHLKNGIKNVNQTMNAFMIYRKEFNHIASNFNLTRKFVSKSSSISWKNEPQYIKNYYKQFAKNVKRRFEEIVPSLCFIHFNKVSNTNDNHVPLDTYINHPVHPLHPPHSIHPIHPIHSTRSIHPIHSLYNDEKFPPLINSPLLNIDQETNIDHYKYMTMNDDELINYLPEDIALTYKAINQSLPF
ncbi:7530_t:CDS:1 [Diversispora eburnea]|uniref:7530_t:CDS:1 n=1 Tax=Diversispora eburnea TaxID=1213867 RepID=A0A9N9BGL8_9GLOM|nr:7530_t:CDS:1 [Diversispora eburnea]